MWPSHKTLKFIYSGKATNLCEISTVDLFFVVTVKSTVEISQNLVAFPEYMNFNADFSCFCGGKLSKARSHLVEISFFPSRLNHFSDFYVSIWETP